MLEPIRQTLPIVFETAARIRIALQMIEPKTGTKFMIDSNFNIEFNEESEDFYVCGNTLVLPLMSKAKLEGLQEWLESEEIPCAFEHEAQHLIDNLTCYHNSINVSAEMLEKRAAVTEKYAELLLRGEIEWNHK